MKCPHCGATVMKNDVVCKKCNTALKKVKASLEPSKQVRSRFVLFFKCWIGGWKGKHLEWLGYDEKADYVNTKYGNLISELVLGLINPLNWVNPMFWIMMIRGLGFQCVECTCVLFGKYRTDAEGHPIRYFKGPKV